MSQATEKKGGVTVPAGLEKKALLKFLVENKSTLIAEKKAAFKKADALSFDAQCFKQFFIDKEGKLQKAAVSTAPVLENNGNVSINVINTTNWIDSHQDGHVPGLWKKSIADNDIFLHLQEHEMTFTHIISDEAKGYTQKMTWKELGYPIQGTTEALVFASPFKGRNPYMEEQYRKGYVKNHSVGMRYVVIKLCVDDAEDEYFKDEYSNWVQYAPLMVNIEVAEKDGFFWAVSEAKVIEGSAVPKGSNIITPSLGFKSAQPASTTEHDQPTMFTGVEDESTKGDFMQWLKTANLVTI